MVVVLFLYYNMHHCLCSGCLCYIIYYCQTSGIIVRLLALLLNFWHCLLCILKVNTQFLLNTLHSSLQRLLPSIHCWATCLKCHESLRTSDDFQASQDTPTNQLQTAVPNGESEGEKNEKERRKKLCFAVYAVLHCRYLSNLHPSIFFMPHRLKENNSKRKAFLR